MLLRLHSGLLGLFSSYLYGLPAGRMLTVNDVNDYCNRPTLALAENFSTLKLRVTESVLAGGDGFDPSSPLRRPPSPGFPSPVPILPGGSLGHRFSRERAGLIMGSPLRNSDGLERFSMDPGVDYCIGLAPSLSIRAGSF